MILSVNQWKLVRHQENLFVTSVPGAGKTRVVQAKAVQEAARATDSPFRIACLTYTNAAAAELSRRILPGLRDDARDRVFIGTIHSFCISEIMKPHAGRLGELLHGHEVATPEHPAVEAIIEELLGRQPTAKDLKSFGEVARSEDGRPEPHSDLQPEIISLYWDEMLRKGMVDFSGVLFCSKEILRQNADVAGSVADSFSWFLIDEYQDTSPAQLRVLSAIATSGQCKWMLIGDFNQSIFGFNGVSRAELEAFSTQRGCARARLVNSYRCRPAIATQATNLLPIPRLKSMEAELQGEVLQSEGDVAVCVRAFLRALRKRSIPVSSAAIIASARWVLEDSISALAQLQSSIPWSAQFRFSGLSSIAYAVSSVLACAYHPDCAEHITSAIAELQGVNSVIGFEPEPALVEVALFECVDAFAGKGVSNLSFLEAAAVVEDRLLQILPPQLHNKARAVFQVALRPSFVNRSPLLIWNGEAIARLTCAHDAITLATIHGAKGLEFRAVLLPAFESGIIPHRSASDVAEERRKAYVAITRSSELLMYGYKRGRQSPFLRQAMGA